MASKLALTGTALAAALSAAALVSCSSSIDGRPVCPGCGIHAEPTVPTARPPVQTPTALPAPPSIDAAVPGGVDLPADEHGYVFIQTKSGRTRCQLNNEAVGCESEFENSPLIDGTPANGVRVTTSGDLEWILGNLGAIPAVTLDYRIYNAAGWTILAEPSGTRFTNQRTGHGMFVAVEGVRAF